MISISTVIGVMYTDRRDATEFSEYEKTALKIAADRAAKSLRRRESDTDRDIVGKLFTSIRQQDSVRSLVIHFPRLRNLIRWHSSPKEKFLIELLSNTVKKVSNQTQTDIDKLRSIVYSSRLLANEADNIIRRSDIVISDLVNILDRE